jgi:hypothetical protein
MLKAELRSYEADFQAFQLPGIFYYELSAMSYKLLRAISYKL